MEYGLHTRAPELHTPCPATCHAGGHGRVLRQLEGDLDVALSPEVVDLVRHCLPSHQVRGRGSESVILRNDQPPYLLNGIQG